MFVFVFAYVFDAASLFYPNTPDSFTSISPTRPHSSATPPSSKRVAPPSKNNGTHRGKNSSAPSSSSSSAPASSSSQSGAAFKQQQQPSKAVPFSVPDFTPVKTESVPPGRVVELPTSLLPVDLAGDSMKGVVKCYNSNYHCLLLEAPSIINMARGGTGTQRVSWGSTQCIPL